MPLQDKRSAACTVLAPRLAGLLDGELSEDERRELDAHLQSCPDCAAELELERWVRSGLRSAGAQLETPAGLSRRVQTALAAATARPPIWRRVLPYAAVAAALVIAALAGLLVLANAQAPGQALLRRAVTAHQQVTLGATPVSFASDNTNAVSAWVKRQSGQEFEVPSLSSAGYQLVGARLDSTVAPSAVTLVYRGPGGLVSCVILPSTLPGALRAPLSAFSPGVRTASVENLPVASWVEFDGTYILTADLQPAQLAQLARVAAGSGSD
jgi:anti-sigma factor (TIGR02949 family)